MAHPTTSPVAVGVHADRGDTLAWAAQCRRTADAADAELLRAACQWADEHPPESLHDAAAWSTGMTTAGRFGDTALAIAGPGAGLVTEFCIPEFAACLGLSSDAGKALIGEALELRDRLPRLWARVQTLELPAWKARRIARHTMNLSLQAAGWLDTQLAPYAHKTGPAQIDRLLTEALARFQPEDAQRRAAEAAETRHATLYFDPTSCTGTVEFAATLDLLDAYDLDDALQQGAHQLADLGSTDPLDVRRSHALGELARLQLTLDLATGPEPTQPGRTKKSRHVVKLHVHLTDAALRGTRLGVDLVRVEEHHQLLLTETLKQQLATWLDRTDLRIHVVPVIDLNQRVAVDSYEIPHRLKEQVILRDDTCTFPWCTRPARGCDTDHITPFDDTGPPGQTATDNLAPLCRRHHRLKTHGGWTYTTIEPGNYLWTSPHGHAYLRDHTGTQTACRRPE